MAKLDFSTRTNTTLGLIDPKCAWWLGMEPLLPKKINSPPSRGSSSYQTQISVPKHTQEQLKRFLQNVLANREHKQIPLQRTPQQEPESQNNPTKTHTNTHFPDPLGPFPPLAQARTGHSFVHLAQWTQTPHSAASGGLKNSNKLQNCCF